MKLGYNRVCNLEDFEDLDLIETIRDVFPHALEQFLNFPKGSEHRKHWEIAMSIRGLRDFGALHPDAEILGVGAGTEATIFYLTNQVKRVFATDLYAQSTNWREHAPPFMLIEPEQAAPFPFRPERLIVQNMNALDLRYPDRTFDGIFSAGSIEHFGSWDDIALAANEMGRVLKPGGILTLSTEFYISGPDHGADGLRFLNEELLRRHIIEPSGCEPVDELHTVLTPASLDTCQPLDNFLEAVKRQISRDSKYPLIHEIKFSRYPHLVLEMGPYTYCSVHLTLRKVHAHPPGPRKAPFDLQAAQAQARAQGKAPEAEILTWEEITHELGQIWRFTRRFGRALLRRARAWLRRPK
ncbi:MAG: class I SAM-dependent methyltransferase [Vulcanimicrobiota bacterium]